MRIAIVGAGPTGLAAAQSLGEDPRHVITVFETRARFGGPVNHLFRLGVTLRHTAQVERLAFDGAGADLWIHGLPEPFDLALVTTSPAEARALLARSGIQRQAGSVPLGRRVYFVEQGVATGPEAAARAALVRMAADHPTLGSRPCSVPARDASVADALRAFARRGTGARVEYVDLSGQTWPLATPAVYVANQRWVLDVALRHLMIRSLRTPEASNGTSATATAGQLEAGRSVAFVVEGTSPPHGHSANAPHGRGAALAALVVNAPFVPIAATTRPGRWRAKGCVVIGEPFYPETSSIDELMDYTCEVVSYLEQLAIEFSRQPVTA